MAVDVWPVPLTPQVSQARSVCTVTRAIISMLAPAIHLALLVTLPQTRLAYKSMHCFFLYLFLLIIFSSSLRFPNQHFRRRQWGLNTRTDCSLLSSVLYLLFCIFVLAPIGTLCTERDELHKLSVILLLHHPEDLCYLCCDLAMQQLDLLRPCNAGAHVFTFY